MAPPAAIDRPLARTAAEQEARIVEAMLECIGRWGVAKTTVDDIARGAGISRATLYRAFPGGKEVAFEALLRHETARFFATVTDRLDDASSLDDLLTVGIVEAARFLDGHEALGYVLRHEPERILPALAFHRLDRALGIATAFTVPHLARFLPAVATDTVARRAEWVVRLLLSYAVNPSPVVELTDPASVRHFVHTFVLPVLQPPSLRSAPADTAPKEP
ncbi:MAG: TetR/AcrR family transcriptional regulator [Acidimicrobiales bacterium]